MGKMQPPLVIALGVGFLVVVFWLVRGRRLKDELSVAWVVAAVAIVLATLSFRLVEVVAPVVGAVYTPSAVFFLAIVFLLVLNLHLSVKLTRLEEDRTKIAQTVALLEERTRRPGAAAPPAETADG